MALALALLLAATPGAADGGPAGGDIRSARPERSDGGADAESKGGAGSQRAKSKGGPDAGDPDDDLVRHLDEIQNLELLENLELFDPGAERGQGGR